MNDFLYFRKIRLDFVHIVYLGRVVGSVKYDRHEGRWKMDLPDAYWSDSQAISYAFEDFLLANTSKIN